MILLLIISNNILLNLHLLITLSLLTLQYTKPYLFIAKYCIDEKYIRLYY